MDIRRNCCLISCLSLVFFGLMMFAVGLIFSNNNPTFFIDDFYVPELNKTTTTTTTTTTAEATAIQFDLKIHNENRLVALYYDDIRIMFSYYPNHQKTGSNIPIGSYQVLRFYQGNHVKDVVETHGYSPFVLSKMATMKVSRSVMRKWKEADQGVSLVFNQPDVVVFRVDLVAHLRFKDILNPYKYRVVVGADVEVNDQTGKKVNKKGIKLM